MTALGQRLKEVRQLMHLSQEEFGAILGAGKSYISSVEHGKSKLSLESLVKLLMNYNVSIDYLLGGIGSPFIKTEHTDNELRSKILEVLKEQKLI